MQSQTSTFIKNLLALGAIVFSAISVIFFYNAGRRLSQQEETQLLVDRIINTYGGRKQLEKIIAFKAGGTLKSPGIENLSAEYTLTWSRDKKLRIETDYGEFREVKVLNGDTGFVEITGSTISPAIGFRQRTLLYQYVEAIIPYHLINNRFEIRNEGLSDIRGIKTIVLTLNDSNGAVIGIHVDSEKHLILKSYLVISDDKKNTELTSEYREFREVNGILFPFFKTMFVDGVKIAEITLNEFLLNPPVDPLLFQKKPSEQS